MISRSAEQSKEQGRAEGRGSTEHRAFFQIFEVVELMDLVDFHWTYQDNPPSCLHDLTPGQC